MPAFSKIAALLLTLLAFATARVVLLDNFNNGQGFEPDSPDSNWAHANLPPLPLSDNGEEFVKGSRLSIISDYGARAFPQGVRAAHLFGGSYTIAARDNSQPLDLRSFTLGEHERIRAEFTGFSFQLFNTQPNPFDQFGVSETDTRRGCGVLILVDVISGQTVCFFVGNDEILVAQDAIGSLAGAGPYEEYGSTIKVASRQPGDKHSLAMQYDRATNEMSWELDGQVVYTHTPNGAPGATKTYEVNIPGAQPLPTSGLASWAVLISTADYHDTAAPSEVLGQLSDPKGILPLDPLARYSAPTAFHQNSYSCTPTPPATMLSPVVPANCPAIDGPIGKFDVAKVKIEIL